MNRTHIALSSIVVVLVLLGSVTSPGIVGDVAAAVEDVEDRPDAYAVEQGSDCIQIEPVGDAETDVDSYYEYHPNATGKWSSHGTIERQESQVSQLYVYRGSSGDSLVFLHDELNDGEGGGAISMTISGLPEDSDWVVEDDDYEDRDDRFQHDGTSSQIDWMWHQDRTDGAAVRGIAEPGYEEITIDPAFGEDSYAATQGWSPAEDELEWTVGDGDGTLVSIDKDEPVSVRQGPCSGTSPPDAELTVDPDDPETGENVTLDASGSSDEDGIVTYRWDVDGDGEVDAETDEPTYVTTYSEEGAVEPAVEVVDGTDANSTATTSVDVQRALSVTADADLPETARAGESVRLDGSNSTGSVEIESYEWTIGNDTELTGEVVDHEFSSEGTFDVTLTVEGSGVTDETTTQVAVTDDDPPTAALDAPASAEAGETITLDASDSTDDQGISEYRWDVDGNGSTDEATETPRLDVSYDEVGEYTPTVAVIDERGQVDEASRTVDIAAGEDFDVELEVNRTTVATDELIEFNATATPEREGVTYEYDFGDGNDTTGNSTTHAYETEDAYTVTVEATGPDGDVATDTTTVTVEARETDSPDDGDSDDEDAGSGGGGGGGGGALEPPGTPSIAVANASLSNSTIEAGEAVDVAATLENDGDGAGSMDVELLVDGTVVDSTSVFVKANETHTLGLTHRFEDTGTFDLRVGEVDAGSLTVVEAGATDRSSSGGTDERVSVADLAASDDPVPVGTPVEVEATFQNDGDSPATFEPTLLVDGAVTSSEELTVPAGDTGTVTFEHTFSSPGSYDVEVDGTERTLVVGDGTAGTPEETIAGGVPGPLYVAIGVLALLAVVVALSRWI